MQRQPGSSFKVFVYASVLENGHHLWEYVSNKPVSMKVGDQVWAPKNLHSKNAAGRITMRSAIKHSVNRAAVHAIMSYTNPDSVAKLAYRCGIRSRLLRYPSLALGTSEVSPLEMASAYAVFADGGLYHTPNGVVKILDDNKRVIHQSAYPYQVALAPEVAYEMTEALKDVVNGGTAYQVRSYYKGVAAGKTGTTENSTDAWFVGYNRKLCTAIWVCFSTVKTLPRGFDFGGSVCAPIWGGYMARAINTFPAIQKLDFAAPDSLHLKPAIKENVLSEE
jgi:penicillin-binding protein 1A